MIYWTAPNARIVAALVAANIVAGLVTFACLEAFTRDELAARRREKKADEGLAS